MEVSKEKIKVSVVVVTYNHEMYIRQCLQSLVDQKTDFAFEVIVSDDRSTDRTQELIREFAEKYPDIIVPVFNEKNLGPTQNSVATHLRARGEFVAHVDGDDLAYPGKLQLQSDFLDENNTFALVWHRVEMLDDAGAVSSVLHEHLNEVVDVNNITRNDLLRFGSLGAASSLMYRRSAGEFFRDIKGEVLDYYVAAMIMKHGNAARLESILGGYRYDVNKKTLSKSGSKYFNISPMRSLYVRHLERFYLEDKSLKEDIFLNSLFHLLVELRFLRPTWAPLFGLTMKTLSFSGVCQIPDYFSKSFKLRARG